MRLVEKQSDIQQVIMSFTFSSLNPFINIPLLVRKKKGKVVPVSGREGPQGCETSRRPYFL
jgi:hypothetical protein